MNAQSDSKMLSTLAMLAVMSGVTGCAAQDPVATETAESSILAGPASPDPGPAPAPTPTPAPAPATPAASLDLHENIQRLRALRIFEVDALQDKLGKTESGNCYSSQTAIGIVCIEDLADRAAEIAIAEKKLSDFTVLAETAAATATAGGPFGPGTNLDALRNLHLFEVGEFIVDQPESRSCYGFCNSSNQKREQQLHRIIEAL